MRVRITEVIAPGFSGGAYCAAVDLDTRSIVRAEFPFPQVREGAAYVYDPEKTEGTRWFRQCTEGKPDAVDVLMNDGHFGPKTSSRIADALGPDIFAETDMGRIGELLAGQALKPAEASAAKLYLRGVFREEEYFRYLCGFGVKTSAILLAERKVPLPELKRNPFLLLPYDVPFRVCDKIAEAEGIGPWAPARLRALALWEQMTLERAGNTREPEGLALRRITGAAARGDVRVPEELAALYLACAPAVTRYTSGGAAYVAPKQLIGMEEGIRDDIRRITATAKACVRSGEEAVRYAEQATGISYSAEQKAVFGVLAKGGLACLTGGPGTGKTTVISGVLAAYRHESPDSAVLLAAPTGRAAAKMGEVAGYPSQTLHHALGKCWSDHTVTRAKDFEYGLIIADEMSMCDTELFACFLRSVRPGTAVLIVGDSEQIPSVGPGQVLKDLVGSGEVPVYRLTAVVRQRAGSLIIRNAARILGSLTPEEGKEFRTFRFPSDEALADRTAGIRKLRENYWEGGQEIMLLIPCKKGPAGVFAMNRRIQAMRTFSGPKLVLDGSVYHIGEPVIMSRNDYDAGYRNGDVGVIEDIAGDVVTVRFRDHAVPLGGADAAGMSLAYAVTCHKAQGGECENVIILLPESASPMACRHILYTAVTRPRRSVTIFYTGDMLDRFLKGDRSARQTSLADILAAEKRREV